MNRVQTTESERERFLALVRRFMACSDPVESEGLREELAKIIFGE